MESEGTTAAAWLGRPINEASAIDPSPMPHRLKKWRRVRLRPGSGEGVKSLTGDGFVEVEQDPANGRPGGVIAGTGGAFRCEQSREGLGFRRL